MTRRDKIDMTILSYLQDIGGYITNATELETLVTQSSEDCIKNLATFFERNPGKKLNDRTIKRICEKDIVINGTEFWDTLFALKDEGLINAYDRTTFDGRELYRPRINRRGEEHLKQLTKSDWRKAWDHLWEPRSRAEIMRLLIVAAITGFAGYLIGRCSGSIP